MIKFFHHQRSLSGMDESAGLIVSINIEKLREMKARVQELLLPDKYKHL